jgi:hypothetical protein
VELVAVCRAWRVRLRHHRRQQPPPQPPCESSSVAGACTTASQLVRSVFQSTMGACEGAFSAEPAAGDHPWGDWGGPWRRWLGPRPTRSCQTPNLVVLWKMRNGPPGPWGAECGRVPGCGRGAPPAGAGSQLGPNRSTGGLMGPRARCGGRGGGQPRVPFKPHNIKG